MMQGGVPFEIHRQALLRNLSLPAWLDAWTMFTGVPAWMTAFPHLHGLLLALAGILVGGGIVWGVRISGRWGLGREAMGFGDVVLLAMIGSFIGWQASLVVFFLAPAFAILWVAMSIFFHFERELPFGPYLSLGALTVLLAFRAIAPAAEAVLALGPFLPVAGMILFVSLMVLLWGMHRIQKRLGYEYREPEPVWEWTSGDQLAHLAGECVDDRQGQWPRDAWRGTLTGRGLAFDHDWRGK
jgi:leader peptidase (prepilin peptidase)/N-methyltransferase